MFINTQEFYKNDDGDVCDLLNGMTMVSRTAAPGRENWFGLDRHYFCPDTGYRVYEFGGVWYNFEEAWRDFYDGTADEEMFRQMERILLSLAEGWKYHPSFSFVLTYEPHGVRATKTCKDLVMMIVSGYELDADTCEADWNKAVNSTWEGINMRSGNSVDTFSVTSSDLNSLSTVDVHDFGGRTYDTPIDLTFIDD